MQDLFVTFALNMIINSFLSFITVWLFVEILLFLFVVKNYRIKGLFRLIPILKLAANPFLYNFSTWAVLQGVNPLNCEEGTRTLTAALQWGNHFLWFPIVMKLQMFTREGMIFTFPDILYIQFKSFWLNMSILFFILLTSFKFIDFFKKRNHSQREIQKVIKECITCKREILNNKIRTTLQKASVAIVQCKL